MYLNYIKLSYIGIHFSFRIIADVLTKQPDRQ